MNHGLEKSYDEARKILRLYAAKIGAGNVIRKRFMTFPIIKNGDVKDGCIIKNGDVKDGCIEKR